MVEQANAINIESSHFSEPSVYQPLASEIKLAIGKEMFENGVSELSLAYEWELCTRTVYRYKEKVKKGLICHPYSGRPRILRDESLMESIH